MSYDVSIGEYSFNHTSNLGLYFRTHFPGSQGVISLHGMTGKQAMKPCISFILSALNEIAKDGGERVSNRYNPENGWGSTDSAIKFVMEMLKAFDTERRKRVDVWA
jgi:hypothetical protein